MLLTHECHNCPFALKQVNILSKLNENISIIPMYTTCNFMEKRL